MHRAALFAFLTATLTVSPAAAAQVTVEVTNATQGIYFTPLLVTAHGPEGSLFTVGSAASESLRAMAEGGDISALVADLGGADADTVADPAGGVLAPGTTVTAVLDTTVSGHTHLSLVGMLLPTNDGFVGLDTLEIPSEPGTYQYPLVGYDAGTEANDELLNTEDGGVRGVPGIPAAPGGDAGIGGTGVTDAEPNDTVHVHRGALGDTEPEGGASDLDSTRHRWLNPVAVLRLTVE